LVDALHVALLEARNEPHDPTVTVPRWAVEAACDVLADAMRAGGRRSRLAAYTRDYRDVQLAGAAKLVRKLGVTGRHAVGRAVIAWLRYLHPDLCLWLRATPATVMHAERRIATLRATTPDRLYTSEFLELDGEPAIVPTGEEDARRVLDRVWQVRQAHKAAVSVARAHNARHGVRRRKLAR
jgi:hypothetical protein